jgi:hypothetical protein
VAPHANCCQGPSSLRCDACHAVSSFQVCSWRLAPSSLHLAVQPPSHRRIARVLRQYTTSRDIHARAPRHRPRSQGRVASPTVHGSTLLEPHLTSPPLHILPWPLSRDRSIASQLSALVFISTSNLRNFLDIPTFFSFDYILMSRPCYIICRVLR